jgi:parallel beta-helix repeat protein
LLAFLRSISSFSRLRQRKTPYYPSVKPTLECLEHRLVLTSPASVSFSPDQSSVTIQWNNNTWTIDRPVISPWNYQTTGHTYWVSTTGSDQNDGSYAHPLATINQAVADAGPGDIVYVESGTYVENLYLTKSGLPGKPIIISAAPGDLGQVTITPSQQYVTDNPDGAVITFQDADYVWINGFVIEGPKGQPYAPATEHYGANGITWTNGAGLGDEATNNVVYNNVHCGMKEMGDGGTGMLIEGNIIFGNGNGSLDHGIYMPASDVTINGNVIFDNAGFGIHAYSDPSGLVISHNVVFDNGWSGILVAGSDNQVYDNTSAYNGQYGIMYFRAHSDNNVVEGNIFADNGYGDMGYDNGGGQLGDPTGNLDENNDYASGINPQFLTYNTVGAGELSVNPQFVDALDGVFSTQSGSPAAALGAFAGLQPGSGTFTVTAGTALTNVTVASFNNDLGAVSAPNASTALINWGDGTTSNGQIVSNSTGGFQVIGSHTYSQGSGSLPYTITVTVLEGPVVQTVQGSALVHPGSDVSQGRPSSSSPSQGQSNSSSSSLQYWVQEFESIYTQMAVFTSLAENNMYFLLSPGFGLGAGTFNIWQELEALWQEELSVASAIFTTLADLRGREAA